MMRTFELSTRITAITRKKGRTATAAAAYRAGCVIACEYEGRTHDYRRKRGVEASQIVLPNFAPQWAYDRASLWNAAEMRERNGKRGKNAGAFKPEAKTAREFLFTFPVELSAEGRLKVAETVARYFTETHGVAVDFAIHCPGKEGDQRNFHCHMMTTTRRLTTKGLAEKAREWDAFKSGAALSKQFRAFVAGAMNAALAQEGKAGAVRVEHRSFKARGSTQVPTRHQGVQLTNMQRKKRAIERNAWERSERAKQRERHAAELSDLKTRQDAALASKLRHLAERERSGIAAIRDALARDQAKDHAPTGAARAFQVAAGQAMRSDFERQTRAAERHTAAERAITELKASVQAERAGYIARQTAERSALTERHRADDGQLRHAFNHRAVQDRVTEVEARREQVRHQQREQVHDVDHDRNGPR